MFADTDCIAADDDPVHPNCGIQGNFCRPRPTEAPSSGGRSIGGAPGFPAVLLFVEPVVARLQSSPPSLLRPCEARGSAKRETRAPRTTATRVSPQDGSADASSALTEHETKRSR